VPEKWPFGEPYSGLDFRLRNTGKCAAIVYTGNILEAKQMNVHRVVITCLLVVSSTLAVNAQSSRTADEAAIRAHLQGYAAARTAGIGHEQALFFTEDGDEWGSAAMEPSKGRAALEKVLDAKPDPNRRFNLKVLDITWATADAVLVDAAYSGASGVPGGHGAYLMVKRDGKWLIRSARIARYPAPPAKP
jgi:hypothetical protein